MPNTLSVVWHLVVVQPFMRVKLAAVLAVLLCVVYAMGLGGIVLWLLDTVPGLFQSDWSPHALSQGVRIAAGSTWVIFFTVLFTHRLFRSFMPLALMRRDVDTDQVIRAGERWVARYRSG